MGQPVVHLEIMGKDAVKLQKFYRELFDWKIGEPVAEMGMYGIIDGESSGIAGGIGQEPSGAVRTTFYVQVPDLQATLDQAVAKGGKVVMPPMEIPGMVTLAQFADPEGNLVGLVKG
ncbi:MAG TPA: VOC family protein [Chloroflexota bacterium]|nr:VOC family protein [Chloroflexota bacterium]